MSRTEANDIKTLRKQFLENVSPGDPPRVNAYYLRALLHFVAQRMGAELGNSMKRNLDPVTLEKVSDIKTSRHVYSEAMSVIRDLIDDSVFAHCGPPTPPGRGE